MIYAKKLLIF